MEEWQTVTRKKNKGKEKAQGTQQGGQQRIQVEQMGVEEHRVSQDPKNTSGGSIVDAGTSNAATLGGQRREDEMIDKGLTHE